jgi:hypothetical protein
MADIAVQPIVLKDVDLTFETDNYAAHTSSAVFTPTTPSVSWQGLSPNATFTETGSESWTLTLEVAQDWTSVNSLARRLFDGAGTKETVKFAPKKGAGLPVFTAEVTLVAPAIGGAVNEYATSQVVMGVDGRPVPDYDGTP